MPADQSDPTCSFCLDLPIQGFGFRYFSIFVFFWIVLDFFVFFFVFFGPGRVPEGSGGAFGFIWTKFQPKWSHFGPVGAHFRFPIFRKPIWGPNSSHQSLGSGPIWGPGPMEAEGRHYGGRRPTFWRGVGGRSPPTANPGGVGGRQPPHRKGVLGAICNSEIRNPDMGLDQNGPRYLKCL